MTKKTVTERALMKRINRRIAGNRERLGVCSPRVASSLGSRFYVVDDRNTVVAHFDDLDQWARDNVPGAIAECETLVG